MAFAYLIIADCSKLNARSLRILSIWSLENTPQFMRQLMLICVHWFCDWTFPGLVSYGGTYGPPRSFCGLRAAVVRGFCSLSGIKFSIWIFWVYLSALDSLLLAYVFVWSRNLLEPLGCKSLKSGPVAFSLALATLWSPLGFREFMDADLAILSWKNWSWARIAQRTYSSKSMVNKEVNLKLSASFSCLLKISLTMNL